MPRPPENLNLQQRVLTHAMRGLGNTTVNYTLGEDGVRYHEAPPVSREQFDQLAFDFARDPKEVLACAREALLAINSDKRLSPEERSSRLDRYMKEYFDLTIMLDRKAFPPSPQGKAHRGVPDYIPDGFVDMGGDDELDPSRRNREQIVVDKDEVFEKYQPVMKKILAHDYSGADLGQKKSQMIQSLARELYFALPYDRTGPGGQPSDLGGGEVHLSGLDEGVCRHQALVFQVLAQSLGLKTRILKSYMKGSAGRHASNMARLDGEWYIVDVTNPDYVLRKSGEAQFASALFKVDSPPPKGGKKMYHVKSRLGGKDRTYEAHDDMHWRIR